MDENFERDYLKGKEVSDLVLEFSKDLVKEDAKLLDVAENIENKIIMLGAKPAWPINISINSIAAHYTPVAGDTTVFKAGDLVKMDIGVQVNGLAVDTAYTVCIGKKSHPMIDSSKKAMEEAMKILKPGVKVCELSDVIVDTVKSFGFNTIRNLSGHGIERHNQHAPPSIPNMKNSDKTEIESGQLIAIEVFTTNGEGLVIDSGNELIFKYVQDRPARMWEARKLMEIARKDFDMMPFAKRQVKGISPFKLDLAVNELMFAGCLHGYSPLREQSNGLVAVWEDTKLVK